jgi:ADP-ribose pyrophosphatase YjhB (NUDIX family)
MFEYIIGEREIPPGYEINRRTAVRAVLLYGDKVLMVRTNRGDYKFPGGGVNSGEEPEKALVREIAEETGFVKVKIGRRLGEVVQQNIDQMDNRKYFVMKSIYYLGELEDLTNYGPDLDDYEAELEFHGELVTLQQALDVNQSILRNNNGDRNIWMIRETEVLKYLINNHYTIRSEC